MKELEDRLAAKGLELEWADVLRDLEALRVVTADERRGDLRVAEPAAGRGREGAPAAGVALGPSLRFLDEESPINEAWSAKCSATPPPRFHNCLSAMVPKSHCRRWVRRASAPGTIRISGLNTQPARTPVNASPSPSRTPVHDSGPVWLATPSPYDRSSTVRFQNHRQDR